MSFLNREGKKIITQVLSTLPLLFLLGSSTGIDLEEESKVRGTEGVAQITDFRGKIFSK